MKRILIAVGLVLAMAGSSFAGVNAGQKELGLQFAYTNLSQDKSSDSTNLVITAVNLGYFFTEHISVGGDVIGMVSSSGGDTTSALGLDANFKWHFMPKNVVVPYLGVLGGYYIAESGGNSGNAYMFGGMGGLKYFITENASLNAELNFKRLMLEDSDNGSNMISALVGLSFYFGK